MAQIPTRPELTFPAEEADFIRAEYASAGVILEYGSGGSTVLASEMADKRVFSVESDKAWSENLKDFLAGHPDRRSEVTLLHVDVGPTKRWGIPASDKFWRNYWRYPAAIYSEDAFQHPDLILVDGIFRPACVITAMLMLDRPTRLVFDDYLNPRTGWTTTRPRFEALEQIIAPSRFVGRMAVFDIVPGSFDPKSLVKALPLFFRFF